MANETRYALPCVHHPLERYPHSEDQLNFAFQREPVVLAAAERQGEAREWARKHQGTERIYSAYAQCLMDTPLYFIHLSTGIFL